MKKILYATILFLLFPIFATAQLGHTRADIIKSRNANFESLVTKSGQPYISYETTMTTEASGSYTNYSSFYFDKDGYCSMVLIIEPLSEINAWVIFLNKKYVKTGELSWKDYATNSTVVIKRQEMKTYGEAVTVTFEYDN